MSLAKDNALARAAHQSYGQYMRDKLCPPKPPSQAMPPEGGTFPLCVVCGAVLGEGKRRYCAKACRYAAQKLRQRERYRERREP